ncbi:MAG: gliding motility-associated C-terminal domain-containing protein, partial [Crocinitomicaceae bacterium]|nr:gliding motility-associated C-terminal domain-containing protein [Crocinitomicaceae bacterium]
NPTDTQIYPLSGCYNVDVQITTVDGCVADTSLTDFICVHELPTADFSYNPVNPDIYDSEVFFENSSTNAVLYNWTFGDGTSSIDFEPSKTFPEIGGETYQVDLTVTSVDGCTDVNTQIVTVNEVVQFYVPNAMTPNADLFNPDFTPVFIPGFTPEGYSLQIFDRWGVIMFESQDPSIGWDGTYQGAIVTEDSYVWKIEFKENKTDVTHRHFGHITVLK